MSRIVKHFRTITKHRHMVIRHCWKAGIFWQGLRHDLSKYAPCEFFVGARYYAGDHSPNENERKEKGYSSAWLHHKGRNKHHFEYWTDYDVVTHVSAPVKMPLRYVVEMFCDRVAASKIYKGKQYTDRSPYDYFAKARNTRAIHPQTSDFLEKLLVMLYEKGERETFAFIRRYMKENKDYES
ncbi:MAG: catalase [Clostridiales bacterium]|nr:catalase [Clostridiales bacterium]